MMTLWLIDTQTERPTLHCLYPVVGNNEWHGMLETLLKSNRLQDGTTNLSLNLHKVFLIQYNPTHCAPALLLKNVVWKAP